MQKKQIVLALVSALAALQNGHVMAKSTAGVSFDVGSGTTATDAKTLGTDPTTVGSGSVGTVESGGTLAVNDTGGSVAISLIGGTTTITNNGTIEQTGTGRAIRDNTGGLTVTVTNNAGATISTADGDVIQMNKANSNVTFYNYGTLTSSNASAGGSQAIDFNAITTGTNKLYNYSSGVITASEADAVRPGVNGYVYNAGTIKSTNLVVGDSSSDGIDAQSNTGVTIVNGYNAASGLIEGARHGITGGNTDTTTNGAYTMSVTNNAGATIQGDNGSGINIDGLNGNEVVTVVNNGTIIGKGVTGDGDGIDVDGILNLTNTGTIKSLQANQNLSEGLSVGGGSITNSGLIEGDNAAGAGGSRGISLVGNDSTTGSSIRDGLYGNATVVNSGTIRGQTGAGIGVTGLATSYTATITNLAGGLIEGGGTEAAVFSNYQALNVINYGTITADSSGVAISLGSGKGTVQILGGSAQVNGNMDGGTGGSTLTITPGTGNSFSYGGSISGFAGVAIGAGTTSLFGTNTYAGDTTLTGGTLVLGSNGAVGTGTLHTLNAATLRYANGVTIANKVMLTDATSFDVSGTDRAIQAGTIGEASLGTGLTKTGTGTLVLDGVNTYTGTTAVNAGTLQVGSVAGSSASLAGDVHVASTGILSGFGTVQGTVSNDGTVQSGVNGGNLTVRGNYAQSAAAALTVGSSNAAGAGTGQLVVTGSATLAAGSAVNVAANGLYGLAAGQRFVAVDAAAAGTQYNTETLKYSADGYTGAISGATVGNAGRSDLVISLGTRASTLQGVSANANAALSGLANYTGISDAALLNLYNAAAALSLDGSSTASKAGAQLGAASQTSLARAAGGATIGALDVVSGHSNSMRMAAADDLQDFGGGTGSGVSTGEAPPQWGLWGQAFGGHAGQSASGGIDGYSANYGGLLIGADRALGERWRAGGAFTYTNTAVNNTDNTAGDTSRVNGYGVIGYASFTGEPWYVNLSAGATLQRYNTTRKVAFPGFSGAANGQFDGQQYVASAEFGYPLAVAGMTLTPLASVTYSYLHDDAYTESGTAAALALGATHTNSVRSNAGVKLEKAFGTRYGALQPYLQLAWTHEYDHSRAVTGASFAAAGQQTAFTTVGASPVSDLADIGLGVTLLRASNLSLTARYEMQAGSGYLSQTGSLRLRQLF